MISAEKCVRNIYNNQCSQCYCCRLSLTLSSTLDLLDTASISISTLIMWVSIIVGIHHFHNYGNNVTNAIFNQWIVHGSYDGTIIQHRNPQQWAPSRTKLAAMCPQFISLNPSETETNHEPTFDIIIYLTSCRQTPWFALHNLPFLFGYLVPAINVVPIHLLVCNPFRFRHSECLFYSK